MIILLYKDLQLVILLSVFFCIEVRSLIVISFINCVSNHEYCYTDISHVKYSTYHHKIGAKHNFYHQISDLYSSLVKKVTSIILLVTFVGE